ncbi:hypothetical protein ONZ45_g13374 [Pleurotus djamor]|nr:hypothetical protein ONZ45_g13374 [Pleurotus djamor]
MAGSQELVPDDGRLRAHIDNLLLEYALTHLTTDYLRFTQDAFSDLLSGMEPIPSHDPKSLYLPTDPFDTLTRIHRLPELQAYEESWTSSSTVLTYIKTAIKVPPGQLKSDRAWEDDDLDGEGFFVLEHCMDQSILSRKARKETPKFGEGTAIATLPTTLASVNRTQTLTTLPTPWEEGEETRQDPFQAMNLRIQFSAAELSSTKELLQSIRTLSHAKATSSSDKFNPPSSPGSQTSSPIRPFSPFVPIFPRNQDAFENPPAWEIKSFSELEPLSVAPLESSDNDLSNRHLAVVNGWETYTASVCSSPSSIDSEEDELDELFEISSPNTELLPQLIEDATMDGFIIARKEQPGCIIPSRSAILPDNKALAELLPICSPVKYPITPQRKQRRKERYIVSPLVEVSRPSLPSSPVSISADGPGRLSGSDDSLEEELLGICAGVRKRDVSDMILKEKLEEKPHRDSFFDVPTLPPPNSYCRPKRMPVKLSELLHTQNPRIGDVAVAEFAFLSKCKGMFTVNTQLSWIPWKSATQLPTVEVMTDADALSADKESTACDRLFHDALLNDGLDLEETDYWTDEHEDQFCNADLFQGFETNASETVILTRQERWRLAGLDPYTGFESNSDADPGGEAITPQSQPSKEDRPNAKRVSAETNCAEDGDKEAHNHCVLRATKRRRLDDPQVNIDDSGIGLEPFLSPRPLQPAFQGPFPAQHTVVPQEGHTNTQDPSLDPNMIGALNDEPNLPSQRLVNPSPNAVGYNPGPLQVLDTLVPKAQSLAGAEAFHSSDKPSPLALPVAEDFLKAFEASSFAHVFGPASFAKLRSKKVSEPAPLTLEKALSPIRVVPPTESDPPSATPDYLYDANTIRPPETWNPPQTVHRYLASMEVIQKQALARALRSNSSLIDLVERESLGGCHIILDPHSAVLFVSLLSLPAECDRVKTTICEQSWKFSHLLVIFEAYPSSMSYRPKQQESSIHAYTPPIVKAVKKLRRDLGIAQACDAKSQNCEVYYAFASSPSEVSVFVRLFGDNVQAKDVDGALWDDRSWLEDEPPQDEAELAAAPCMNTFAAFVILCQVDLDTFLELAPDVRAGTFGPHIGTDRVLALNACIEQRMQDAEIATRYS